MDHKSKASVSGNSVNFTEKSLSGLSDFTRSYNLGVLVNDPSLKKAYEVAVADGELPTNRARVLILGEPRAGKTSLLNRLLGRDFDRREQPTHGIETRMCHVTNVDKQWNESGRAKADDIQECASAVLNGGFSPLQTTSPGVQRRGAIMNNRNLNGSTASSNISGFDTWTVVMDAVKFGFQLTCILAVVFSLGMFRYGFAVFTWCCIGGMTSLQDHSMAYRFGTALSFFCVLFDAMVRTDQSMKDSACEADDASSQQALQSLSSALFYWLHSVMVGLAIGLGARTGIAVAFSACVYPLEETTITWEAILGGFEYSRNMIVPSGIFGAGVVITFGCYVFCTANNSWHFKRTGLCCGFVALLLALCWKANCEFRPYSFIFLIGTVTTAGGAWGVIFGRRAVLKYGFEASYVPKKTAGFILGLYLAHVCGWTLRIPNACLHSLAFYILSIAAHPLFDLYTSYKIWSACSTFPIKVIRNHMKAAIMGKPILETKLSLWDFAGDTLYHCAHHVFMPDRALYIVVFNLEAAVSDEDQQLQKLLFWLHSVCAHARHPDAVIMIVGTHKASVSESSRLRFASELHRRITFSFCHRLVLNPADDKPLFLVENSQPSDQHIQQLRAEILRRVEAAEYTHDRYPIKYLHFYREIQSRRQVAAVDSAAIVMTLEKFQDLARDICHVEGEDDLHKMLRFFCEAGEIIHTNGDEKLRQYVVLDPQFLVDVMKKLVRIPRGSDRSHRYAVEWRNYQSSGIITEGLLRHIYENMSDLVPLLTHLLQAYDLMCPVAHLASFNFSQKSYLVPAMLPPFRGDPLLFWESTGKEDVFYFDFGFFNPSTIYHRLLTRCLTHACLDQVNQNSPPLIFADRCRFHIGTSFIFKLQLESRSSQQMLISVTVLAFERENPTCKLLTFLCSVVKKLTARDYPHLSFTFGPQCPFCSSAVESGTSSENLNVDSHGSSNRDETIHVLKMAAQDQSFPTTSPVMMLCNLRRYEFKLPGLKPSESHRGSSSQPQRVTFTMATPITKLPPDLFHLVCSLLNTSSVNRNWKTLAGELGKDIESVAGLDTAQVANPTERLLQEWAMTDGGVTVGDLLEILSRPSLQRMDIIAKIRSNMTNP